MEFSEKEKVKEAVKEVCNESHFVMTSQMIPFSFKDEPQNKSKWRDTFKELHALYGPTRLRRMALICHYTWCVTALSYYVTGKLRN